RAQRLYEQTDATLAQRVEELIAIEEISRQLNSSLDRQRVMVRVFERAMTATHADRGGIALYDREERGLRFLAQAGFPPLLQRYQTELWPDDMGITGRVARTGKMAVLADVTKDPDYVAGDESTRSELTVPIVHRSAVIGVITLESDELAAFSTE